MKVFTYGFLTDGSWQAHGVILFESTTPLGAFPEFRSGVIIYESMRCGLGRGISLYIDPGNLIC
jgi:hypothetical protein